ncbi:MAG: glucose 1-dehydrogenase [Candidatus Lokiarchaeota archaeon]|nr:glucose 1-dehydrogenase [Candidatus Lokiarchaeota archaeon]MBD3341862.1 glucose 1-dehydrogenase [Candidatus Lokiarchaeota archaeon]
MNLNNKVAIVTGSGAGIGEATAKLFANQGAKVCCNSVSASAKRVVEGIKLEGGNAIFVQADVSIEDQAKRIVEETIKAFGKIDILFNNAGIVVGGAIDTTSTEDWDRVMAVNVRGIYLVSKYSVPYLKKTNGVIINNSSSVAFKGVENRAAYTASKGAVLSMTRAMAMDYLKDNIRVNAICPGTTESPSLEARIKDRGGNYEEVKQKYTERQRLGRLGKPEEIAQGVLFLTTNEFCTGVSLLVDGGMTM